MQVVHSVDELGVLFLRHNNMVAHNFMWYVHSAAI
jgi:hypothetical protein